MVKTCVTCGVEYQYETHDELKQFFYKKGDWFRNTCKSCECKQHAEKYAKGEYNYYKRHQAYSDKQITVGFF
jgi:hypothetical protein